MNIFPCAQRFRHLGDVALGSVGGHGERNRLRKGLRGVPIGADDRQHDVQALAAGQLDEGIASSMAASRSRISRAAATTLAQGTSSPGSMSSTMRSHKSRRSMVEPRTCTSSTPACTSDSSPSRSSTAMIWRPLPSITVLRYPPRSGPAEACFWKKHCPAVPSGQRNKQIGLLDEMRAPSSPTPSDSSPRGPAW